MTGRAALLVDGFARYGGRKQRWAKSQQEREEPQIHALILQQARTNDKLQASPYPASHYATYLHYATYRAATKGSVALETYLITFACYGCHIHGDESGSVDREHNAFGGRLIEANPARVLAEKKRMDQPPYSMDRGRSEAVLAAIVKRCSERHWNLRAAHVRTNHVHVVVAADVRPERIMNDLKSYASRYLNRLGFDDPTRKRWAWHGSTGWLWKRENVLAAIRYVVDHQGEAMSVFEAMGE